MLIKNTNATDTEKQLYKYAGLYLIESSEDCLKYAPVHNGNMDIFPAFIDVEQDYIEYENMIVFDKLSECVKLNSWYDIDIFDLIYKRMEELNFKKTFIN